MTRLLIAATLFAALAIGPGRAPAAATGITFQPAPLVADYEWDWDGFKRFWKRQLGQSTGVVGIVLIVVGGGVLMVMSTRRKN
jgi:hypothetical protein